jgi:hypothetical protein
MAKLSSHRVSSLRSQNVLPISEELETRRFCDGSFSSAVSLGAVSGIVVKLGTVDAGANKLDFYKFTTSQPGRLRVSLTKISGGDPNVLLFNAANSGALIGSSTQTGTMTELIDKSSVSPGTYYVEVKHAAGGTAKYQLDVVTDYAGNTTSAARNLGSIGATTVNASDFLGTTDTRDFYKITAAKSGVLHIRTDGITEAGDCGLELIDADNTSDQVISQDGAPAELYHNVTAGNTYYLLAFNGVGSAFNYNVHFSVGAIPADTIGNTLATAKNIGTLTGTSSPISDWIVSPSDKHDYFKLSVAKAGDVRVAISGATDFVTTSILNSSGATYSSFGIGGKNHASITTFHAPAAGTYYVHLSAPANLPNDVSPYTVQFAFVGDFADNTQSTAKPFPTVNGNPLTFGFVNSSDTVDWYSIHVSAGQSLYVHMEQLSNDANLFLYNSSGKLIASSALSGKSDELASATNLADGTYFVRVAYKSGGPVSYLLRAGNQP